MTCPLLLDEVDPEIDKEVGTYLLGPHLLLGPHPLLGPHLLLRPLLLGPHLLITLQIEIGHPRPLRAKTLTSLRVVGTQKHLPVTSAPVRMPHPINSQFSPPRHLQFPKTTSLIVPVAASLHTAERPAAPRFSAVSLLICETPANCKGTQFLDL